MLTSSADRAAAYQAAYECAADHAQHLTVDALQDVHEAYEGARDQVDRDSDEWWALQGAVVAVWQQLRARVVDELLPRVEHSCHESIEAGMTPAQATDGCLRCDQLAAVAGSLLDDAMSHVGCYS